MVANLVAPSLIRLRQDDLHNRFNKLLRWKIPMRLDIMSHHHGRGINTSILPFNSNLRRTEATIRKTGLIKCLIAIGPSKRLIENFKLWTKAAHLKSPHLINTVLRKKAKPGNEAIRRQAFREVMCRVKPANVKGRLIIRLHIILVRCEIRKVHGSSLPIITSLCHA
jgi:hypothetical protein